MTQIFCSFIVLLISISASASPIEITPRAAVGDMQFGFSCDYYDKQHMDWSLVMTVNESLPSQSYAAVFNNKTGKYMSAWETLNTANGLVYFRKNSFDEVYALLPNLSDSELHLKTSENDADISFYFPLGTYRARFPNYFIDNVNQNKGCVVSVKDIPKN